MHLNEEFYRFIQEHLQSDVTKLLLSENRQHRSFDFQLAIEQIEARKKIKNKLPTWEQNLKLIFPSKLSSEQASSEQTARYKQNLVVGKSICDLTGGLGVDLYYMSQKTEQAIYVERFSHYCETAAHNFSELKATSIEIICDDCTRFALNTNREIDTFYIDPARRGKENKRLFALSDYEPNVLKLIPELIRKSRRTIVKVSPMADITACLVQFDRTVSEVHVISVKNECKELLFVLDREPSEHTEIICVNLDYTGKTVELFRFFPDKEKSGTIEYAEEIDRYLFEPNASLLKAGAFKSLTEQFQVKKLAPNSHLYTSTQQIENFPGRRFRTISVVPFQSRTLSELSKRYRTANITTRNFPLSVETIRKKTKIKDGGDIYLFATTLSSGKKVIVEARKHQT